MLVQLGVRTKKNANRSILVSLTKFKYKWINDLHIKPDTLKLIEGKVRKSLKHMGTGEIFLNRIPMAQAVRTIIDKWDLVKLRRFYYAKDTVNRKNSNL